VKHRVFLVDNYDSFTWNLAQLLGALGAEVRVERNDAVDESEIDAWSPSHIVLSPGPGSPEEPTDFGVCRALILRGRPELPLLGVCLGHQGLAYLLGGRVVRGAPVHGKQSRVHHDGTGLFSGVPSPFPAMRYHSLVVDPATLPGILRVTARTEEGVIMGVQHRRRPWFGVQFHPESVGTPLGSELLANFLAY
jgi:anthranilate synthase/aminodeoxychorismate synthase-like glutamine amidotransferase